MILHFKSDQVTCTIDNCDCINLSKFEAIKKIKIVSL